MSSRITRQRSPCHGLRGRSLPRAGATLSTGSWELGAGLLGPPPPGDAPDVLQQHSVPGGGAPSLTTVTDEGRHAAPAPRVAPLGGQLVPAGHRAPGATEVHDEHPRCGTRTLDSRSTRPAVPVRPSVGSSRYAPFMRLMRFLDRSSETNRRPVCAGTSGPPPRPCPRPRRPRPTHTARELLCTSRTEGPAIPRVVHRAWGYVHQRLLAVPRSGPLRPQSPVYKPFCPVYGSSCRAPNSQACAPACG